MLGTVETVTRNEFDFPPFRKLPATRRCMWNDIAAKIHSGRRETHEMGEASSEGRRQRRLTKGVEESLDLVKPDELGRDLVKQEYDYLKLLYSAKLAISDESNAAVDSATAGKQMIDFVKKNPNSPHYYEANEVLGDLLVSMNKIDAATNFYKELDSSPWPDYHARSALLRGRALQMQGKYDQALEAYDAVLKIGGKGPLAEQEKLEATIGRTYSLAGQGKANDAIKVLKEIVANADDDDTETLARAYDALGNCYLKTNDAQQALWAYLRVDTEYSKVGDAHAGRRAPRTW